MKSRREEIELWWPMIARGIGAAIILAQAGGVYFGHAPSELILGSAGSLLVAPWVVGAQGRRNGKRDRK